MMVLRPAAIVKVVTLAVVMCGPAMCFFVVYSWRYSWPYLSVLYRLIVVERGGYRVCWIVTDVCCMSIAQPSAARS